MNARRLAGIELAKKLVIIFLVAVVCFTTLVTKARAFTGSRITDQIEVIGYYDDVDYYRKMKECAQDGSKCAMIVGGIYEEQRNFKIDKLHLPYEKTAFFENHNTGAAVLKAMEEEATRFLQKKIERMKSEYTVAGQVYEYLNGQGMSDVAIAGILGNMMAECGGQTLDLDWDIYGSGGGGYYGLCQWSLNYNPDVDGRDVTGQLDYLMSNIRINMDYFDGDYNEFCAITEAETAAKYFCNYYERGAGTSTRARNAVTALAWIQKDGNINDGDDT